MGNRSDADAMKSYQPENQESRIKECRKHLLFNFISFFLFQPTQPQNVILTKISSRGYLVLVKTRKIKFVSSVAMDTGVAHRCDRMTFLGPLTGKQKTALNC
jgi:hypothetical protein